MQVNMTHNPMLKMSQCASARNASTRGQVTQRSPQGRGMSRGREQGVLGQRGASTGEEMSGAGDARSVGDGALFIRVDSCPAEL